MLKRTSMSDCLLYYYWANDPVVRANSFNQANISINRHIEWFRDAIKTNEMFMFIVDGIPVGQIRINDDGVISYSIDTHFRGMGYGTKMIKEVEKVTSHRKLVGYVKLENEASNRVLEKNGYIYDLKNCSWRKNLIR